MDQKQRVNLAQIEHKDIHIDRIYEGTRYREDLGDIQSLVADIEDKGLIQPIAVTKYIGELDFDYELIAGGRRFTAIKHILSKQSNKMLTCRVFPEGLDEFDRRMLELSENLHRKDFTFQEDLRLKEKIDSLYKKKYGIRTKSEKVGHSTADTATLLGVSKSSLQGDLELKKAMNTFKSIDWNQFNNKNEAMKAVKQIKKKAAATLGAREAKKVLGTDSNTTLKNLADAYMIMDCRNGLKEFGNKTVDLVEIDPPYAIDLTKVKKDYNYEGYNEIAVEDYIPMMRTIFDECYRIMKKDSWLICWYAPEPWSEILFQLLSGCTRDSALRLYDNLERARNFQTTEALPIKMEYGSNIFAVHRMSGIWVKPSGQTHQPSVRMANAYETFFYARKGGAVLNKPGVVNTFIHKPVSPSLKIHPTERPYNLIKDLLETFGMAGNRVVVPFAGSGKTLIAAADLNMIPHGFDLTQEFKDKYLIQLTKKERN